MEIEPQIRRVLELARNTVRDSERSTGYQVADAAVGAAEVLIGLVTRIVERRGAEAALEALRAVAYEGTGPLTDADLDDDVRRVMERLRSRT